VTLMTSSSVSPERLNRASMIVCLPADFCLFTAGHPHSGDHHSCDVRNVPDGMDRLANQARDDGISHKLRSEQDDGWGATINAKEGFLPNQPAGSLTSVPLINESGPQPRISPIGPQPEAGGAKRQC
jgi:hypothetical protein